MQSKKNNLNPKEPKRVERGNARAALDKLIHKPEHLIDPQLHKWAEQLFSLFRDDNVSVPMPLFTNSFPCPTVVLRGESSNEISVATSTVKVIQIFPNATGPTQGVDGFDRVQGTISGGPMHEKRFGPPTQVLTAALGGTFENANWGCVYSYPGSDSGAIASKIATTGISEALPWNTVSSPGGPAPGGADTASTDAFRCAAFQVRVTLLCKAIDIEGWVECYLPYEAPHGTSAVNPVFGRYRTQGYCREFFGNGARRSFTFTWVPTCDELEWTHWTGYGNGLLTQLAARFNIVLGGFSATRNVLLEVRAVYEYAGQHFITVTKGRAASSDSLSAVNAISSGVESRDIVSATRDTKAKQPSPITKQIVAHKVRGHPWLSRAVTAAGGLLQDVESVWNAAKKVAPVVGRILGPVLV